MSRMETYTTSISLGEESAQMWNLNKRLEAYLSRVKALEEENELLRAEIHHLKSTRSDKSVIRKYHDEIMKLRDALDEEHREIVQVETDRDCIYQEIEYVKDLCLQEKQAQEDVKKELSESKKLLEEEKRAQAWLKERLIHLEEEMEDILKTHEEDKALMEEEISSYSQKLENFKLAPVSFKPVNVEDYASKMSQIWQGAVEEYKIEVSALETNLSQAKENLKKVLDENKQSQLQLQTLDRDLQSLKGRKEMLEELLAKQWLDQQDEENRLQLEIETLEKEKEDLRVQIAQVLEDRQQLMHLKMSLSLEVATYRSLLEAESTRLYTPSADYKISSSFGDSMLDQNTLKKSRHENTKSLISRDNRLSAKKNQSVETSSTSRYLNMKSTSLSNRASPVTKEFQKVSSVLQSQSLNYTKASPAKATPTRPPVESNLRKHPQEAFKKSKVETISHSYSRDSFKPITKETVRKETVIQSVVNGSAYDTADAGLQKTNRTGDAKAEFPLSTEKEVVSAKLETSSKTDLVPEEQQKFVETQNNDNDALVFEKPHQEKVDIEVPLPIDDHAGENIGSVDEEHIIEKQEVISQIVSCQRVYVEKEALVEPLDYEYMETPVRENYEEFRKVLDFSKPNKQDLGEPNVLSSGDVSDQEIDLSQELDIDNQVSDVDKASQEVNQGVDEEKEEIPQDTNILEYNDNKLDQQSSIQDDDILEADQRSDEKQEVTQRDHEEQEGIELAGTNKEEIKTESRKEEEEKDYTHEQIIHESTDIEQSRILNVEEVYQSSHHVLEDHEEIQLQSQEEKNNIEVSDPEQDSQTFKDQLNTDIVKAPEEIAQEFSDSNQEDSVDQKNEDAIDQMDNAQKEASQLSEDVLGSPQAGLEDLKSLDLSNAEEESQEVGGDYIENKQVARTLESKRGNQILDSHPDLKQEELHENVEVISNEEVEDFQKVVQSYVETQILQTTLEQQAREDVTEEEEGDIKTIMREVKDGEEDKKDVIEEECKSYEEDNVAEKEETTSAGEEDSCISEYKEEDKEDLKEENYEAFTAAEYTKAVKTEVIAQYVQKEYVSFEEDNVTEKEESTPADDEEDSCVPEDKENMSEESYEVCTVVEYTKSMKTQVIAQTIHKEYVSYEEDSVTEKEEPTLAGEEENSCTLEHETEKEQEQVKENVFSAEDEYKEKVKDEELVQKESDVELNIAKEDVSLLQQETEPIVEGQSEVSTDMEQDNAKLGDVHQDSEVSEDLPIDRETHLQNESEDLVQPDGENHHEESSEVVQTTEEYSSLKEDETKQFAQKDDIMEDAQTNATLESQEKETNVKQDEEGGNEVEEKSSFQQEPEEGQKGYDQEAKEEKDGDHQKVEVETKGHQDEEEERLEADQQEVEKPQEVEAGQEGHHHKSEEGQQSYQQEVGEAREGSHQEVEKHESHDQEVEDHVASEENQSIQKDSAEEQYMGFSLNIIPTNLRFSSQNDEETQPDQQEQRSNTPEEGTETHKDDIQAHEGEFESFEQAKNIILEEKEKEQEFFEKEIICQQSTFSLAHEYENLHSENIKSHVVFAENPTEKYDFETPTEKHRTELEEIQAASNPDNENSKSEDSLDSQDISIYSPRSEEFEISKDYQCEQTLPDTTPLPNLDDEFEDLAEDEIILASEHSAELKSQSPPDSGEVEKVLDSSLESQSSQILAEVREQSNLSKDDDKDLDYTEQQAEGSKDLLEKELPTQFVDSKKTDDSSETLDTEEPSAEPNTQTEDNKLDDESSEFNKFTTSEDDVILPTKVDELEATKDSQLENTKDQEQLFSEQLPTQSPNLDDEFENLAEDEIISASEVTELQSPADDGKVEEVLDSSLESQSSQVLADDDKGSDYVVDSKAEDSSPILDTEELAEEPNPQTEDLIDNKVDAKTSEFKDSTISQEEVVTFSPKVDDFEYTKDSQLEEIQYETSLPELTPKPENLTDEQLSSEQLSSDSVDKGYTEGPEEGWTANTENVLLESTEFVPSSGLSEAELAPASSHEDRTISEEHITEEHSDFRLVETERVDTEDHKRETCEEDITSLPNLGGEFENLVRDEILLTSEHSAEVIKLQSPEDGDEPEMLDSSLESQSSQILPEVSEESSFIKEDDKHHTEQQAESPEDLFESEQPKQFVDLMVEDSCAIPDTEDPATEPSEDPIVIKLDDENSESEESITSQEEVAISPKVKEFEPTKDSQLEETQCETSPSDDQVELSGEQLVSETVDKDQNEEDEEKRISLDEDVKILTKDLDFLPSSDHRETEFVPAPSQEDTTENEEYITKEHSDLLTQEFNLQQTETVDAEDHDVDFLKKEDKEITLDLPHDGTKEPSTESVDEFNGDNITSSNVPDVLSEESEVQDKIIQAENQEDVNVDVKPSEESSENDDSATSDESSPNVSTISYTPEQEDGKTQHSEKDDVSGDIDSKTPKELEQNDPEQVPEASLVEKLEPQTSSEEEKDILGEKNDSSFDSHEEREEDMSEVIREYNEEGKTVNGIFGHTIVQATLDFEDHMFNGHSTGENREIVISEAKTVVRLDDDIVYSQSQDKVEDSVIEFTISEGKSEGLFQSLLETSEHKEGRLDEASEIKNFMQAAVKYVDSASEQSHYTKEIVNPYLSEKDLDAPSEITSSMVDEDFVNTNKEISKTSQGLKMTQEREDSWSSDE